MFADPDRAAPLLADLTSDLAGPLPDLAERLGRCGDGDGALLALHRLWERHPDALKTLLAHPNGPAIVLALAASGSYLPSLLLRVPGGFDALGRAADGAPFPWPGADQLAEQATDFADLQQRLRHLAGRAYLYLAAGDLGLKGDLFAATGGLCTLAEITLDAAILFCRAELATRHGDVLNDDGSPCPLMVLGMGKLGAGELNYGSDIDLILLHGDAAGETDGPRPLSVPAFFARLSRNVCKALAEVTADGKVFRVDLRLRPEGGAGIMAWPVSAAMAYYETVGDTWERAAYIKARPVAGDRAAGQGFLDGLMPFVFRRYLDFTALEAIRQVKERIHARQVARDQVGSDVKLGTGGIRDIEFFAQSQQLIHGGHNPALRTRETVPALDALAAAGHVAADDADFLKTAYVFLRHVEHRVQLVADRQTHLLPDDPVDRSRLAAQMGFDGWTAFRAEYRRITDRVHRISHGLFGEPEATDDVAFEGILPQFEADPEGADLSPLKLRDADAGRVQLRSLLRAVSAGTLPEQTRTRWRRLLPLFFADIAAEDDPDLGLAGLTRFAEGLKGRGIYAAMLYENPAARRLLSRLFCASRFLTGHLARHPALLDELLAPPQLLGARDREVLREELAEYIDTDDEEAWLDGIRRFKHREVLRVGLRELLTGMDEAARGTALADLAQVLVTAVLEKSWAEMVARHGVPPGIDPDTGTERPAAGAVAVVAMGRLGGGEMGYASDLDLVFIHNGTIGGAMAAETPGPRPIAVPTFYARLGQKIVSKLTVGTGEGVLYQVDMRLRPSGAAGQLVTSLEAFIKYQAEQAWTWEKQALTRSRVVAAIGGIGPAVSSALIAATYTERDPETTRQQVADMRARMREHLTRHRPGTVHLKHDPGGIVDIEFIVQYLLLVHGAAHPEVIDSNPRAALRKLADAGLIDPPDADTLLSALSLLRTVEGYLNRIVGEADQAIDWDGVPIPGGRRHWYGRAKAAMARVQAVFERIVGPGDAGRIDPRSG